MFGKIRLSRWLIGAVVLAAAECASVAAVRIRAHGAGASPAAVRRPLPLSEPPTSAQRRLLRRLVRRLQYAALSGRARAAATADANAISKRTLARAEPAQAGSERRPVTPTTSIVVHGRRHGRLARLRAGGRVFRHAGSRHRAQEQDSFRPVALRSQRRSRLVARRARHPGAGEAKLRGHDARRQRPPEHSRAGSGQGSRQDRPKKSRKRKPPTLKAQGKDQPDDLRSGPNRSTARTPTA